MAKKSYAFPIEITSYFSMEEERYEEEIAVFVDEDTEYGSLLINENGEKQTNDSEEEETEKDFLMRKKRKKRKRKKKKKDPSTTRFDFTFFKRYFAIFFCHFNIFSFTQIFLFLVVVFSSVGNSIFSYFVSILRSDMYVDYSHERYTLIWQNILFMAFLNVLQSIAKGFSKLATNLYEYFWKKNLTFSLLRKYFEKNNYYEILHLKDHSIDNPDQRIQSDCSDLCSDSSEVFVGVIPAFINVCYTTGVVISKKCYILLIPIYIFPIIDIIVYSCLFTPVGKQVFRKDKYEGFFRFRHASIREHSESIVFFHPKSEETEKRNCERSYSALLRVWTCLIFWQTPLWIWGVGHKLIPYGCYLAVLLIMVFGDISPFTDEMDVDKRIKTISLLYQIAKSCGDSISDLFDLSSNISSIVGNTGRIGQLLESFQEIEKKAEIKKNIRQRGERKDGYILNNCFDEDDDDPEIRLEGVFINTPQGKELIGDIDLQIRRGEHTIIMGPSGVGKSSILRVISGLWEFKKGVIRRPENGLFFLPQKPYLIQSSLKANVVYPYDVNQVNCSDEKLKECMEKAGISYLLSRATLHQEFVSWDKKLSLGEKQRVVIARLLFHSPVFALLDESTSALDEHTQELCYEAIIQAGITCVSIAHRDSVQKYHKQIMRVDHNQGYIIENVDPSKVQEVEVNWKTIRKRELLYDEKYEMIMSSQKTSINIKEEGDQDEKEKKKKLKRKLFKDPDDSGTGGSGFNCKFFQRILKLMFGWILVRRCCFIFYIIFAFVFNVLASAATLPLFFLSTRVMATICEKDNSAVIVVLLYFLFFSLCSFLWGINTTVWEFMEMRIRTNLTKTMQNAYFRNRNLYKLNILDGEVDNFDQRCCNDAASLAKNINKFFNVLTEAGTISFVIVLGGTFLAGITLPLFIVILFIFSGSVQIILMIFISKKRFLLMKREGYFRHSLVRMKEYSEQIAFFDGKEAEREIVEEKFRRFLKIQLDYNLLTTLNDSFSEMINYISAALSYAAISVSVELKILDFSKMTTKVIISKIQSIHFFFAMSMSFFRNVLGLGTTVGVLSGNVARVAQSLEKLKEMDDNKNIWKVDDQNRIDSSIVGEENEENEEKEIVVRDLTVLTPLDNKKLILGLNFEIGRNDHLLIQGPSGSGKSSLLRVIAGLWNSSENSRIKCPKNNLETDEYPIYFLPQRSYVLYGSLLQNVIYPESETERIEDVEDALIKVNLGYLKDRYDDNDNNFPFEYLYERKNWSTILSPGEQQRLAVARVFFHRVSFVLMDESTSALDLENEDLVYKLCLDNGCTLLSVGHRNSIVEFHNMMLELDGVGGWRFAERVDVEEEIIDI